jgi:hypothetical protein
MRTLALWIGFSLAASACTTSSSFNPDTQCTNATGRRGVLGFCGTPGANGLALPLGSAAEGAVFDARTGDNFDFASVAASDGSVAAQGGGNDALGLIGEQLGTSSVVIYDAAGAEIDEVAVTVTACDKTIGEYGRAAFCGDHDGHHRLAVPLHSRARLAVFTPSLDRLDIEGIGASDWSIVTPSLVDVGKDRACDPAYDYCTNIVDVVGNQLGSADIAVYALDGTEADQVTIDVIDHW